MQDSKQNLIDRTALYKLTLIVEEFRKIDPELPMQQALTLLAIAAEPGLTLKDYARQVGVSEAALSRHVQLLGTPGVDPKGKYGMVVAKYDTVDTRRKITLLTDKGHRSVAALIKLTNHE